MASCGGWLVTVRPGRLGKSLARHYDLAARSSPTDPGHAGDGSAAPRPKTATVERREASVPRHGTQGASQAPGVSRHDTPNGCSAEHPNVSRRSAAAMAKLLGSIMYFGQGSAIPVLSPVRRTGVVTLGQGPKSSRGGTAKRIEARPLVAPGGRG